MKKLAMVILALMIPAAAARAKGKEIFVNVGRARFSDNAGSLGTGAIYGGGIGVRPLPLIGFEVSIQSASHSRDTSGGAIHFEGTPTFYSGNVLLHFPGVLIRPFLSAGLGGMHWSGIQSLRSTTGAPDKITNQTANEFAMNFGAGLKISVLPHVALRPEIRYYKTRPSSFGMIQATIGLSLTW